MYKMMIDAPKDRAILVIDSNGQPHKAQWIDQEASWKRHEVHGFVAGDSVVDAALWMELPTKYELHLGNTL